MVNDASFPTSRSYFALALAFVAFVIYSSLLPFDLQLGSPEEAWDQFRTSMGAPPPQRISRSDVLANILLFMPIGFFLAGGLLVARGRHWRRFVFAPLIIVPTSVMVSLVAEFLQTFSSNRVPSSIDIAAQTVGCFMGIAVWGIAGQGVTRWLRHALVARPEDRLSRLLTAFAAGWVFVNLAPFDITVDLGDLADRVRTGRITVLPFGGADLPLPNRIWDAIAEVLSASPLGALGVVGWDQRRHSRLRAFGAGAGLVILVEAAQAFISSHTADSADVIFGWTGVALGVWGAARLVSSRELRIERPLHDDLQWRAVAVLAAWCVVLCAYHWLPYDFSIDEEVIRGKLARISLVPFAGYLSGSYLNTFNNLLTKVALSIPFGVSAAFVFRNRSLAPRIIAGALIMAAACLFAAIEAGQFFLRTRTPDPTDVFVGVIGAYLGLSLGRWLQASSLWSARIEVQRKSPPHD